MTRAYIELCIDTAETNDPGTTNPVVRVELSAPVATLDSVLFDLVKPALLACGFPQETVDKVDTSDAR